MRGKEKYGHSSCTHFSLVPPWLHSLDSVFFKWYLKRFFFFYYTAGGLLLYWVDHGLQAFFLAFILKKCKRTFIGKSIVTLFLNFTLQVSFNNEMVTSVVFNICNYSQSYCRRTKMSV